MSPWRPSSTVAFIGTREFHTGPPALRQIVIAAAQHAGTHDLILNTGAAEGADQTAAISALQAGGRVRLVSRGWLTIY